MLLLDVAQGAQEVPVALVLFCMVSGTKGGNVQALCADGVPGAQQLLLL